LPELLIPLEKYRIQMIHLLLLRRQEMLVGMGSSSSSSSEAGKYIGCQLRFQSLHQLSLVLLISETLERLQQELVLW
jgi:hypothetical protein